VGALREADAAHVGGLDSLDDRRAPRTCGPRGRRRGEERGRGLGGGRSAGGHDVRRRPARAASVAFWSDACRGPRAESVSPVLTFNNWPARERDDPGGGDACPALLTMAPSARVDHRRRARSTRTRLPARCLAPGLSLRHGRRRRHRQPTYMLNPSDCRPSTCFRTRGIRRVVYVVESLDDSAMEEDESERDLSRVPGRGDRRVRWWTWTG